MSSGQAAECQLRKTGLPSKVLQRGVAFFISNFRSPFGTGVGGPCSVTDGICVIGSVRRIWCDGHHATNTTVSMQNSLRSHLTVWKGKTPCPWRKGWSNGRIVAYVALCSSPFLGTGSKLQRLRLIHPHTVTQRVAGRGSTRTYTLGAWVEADWGQVEESIGQHNLRHSQ